MKQEVKLKQTEIGLIPEDWGVSKVSSIGKVVTGKTPPTKEKTYFGADFMFVKIPDMGNGVYIKKTKSMLSKKGAEYMKRLRLPKDSIMVSCIATVGEVSITSEDSFTNQQINSIIPNERVNPLWVYYYFKNSKDYLISLGGGGSVYTNISKSKFEELSFIVPKISEQKAIAKVLSDLDSKIELLQQQNKTLENIGKTIFKQWFVDFEFPNEEGKPYKSSGGEMVESELGEIPKGWEIKKLEEFLDVQKGLSYKGKSLVEEGGLPMANLGTFNPIKGFKPDGLKFYDGEHKERHLVKPGDMLIANTDITQRRDVLGSPAIIPRSIGSDKVLFTHHTFAVRFKDNIVPKSYLFYLLQTPEYRDRARGFATGTTVLALPKEAILELTFAVAPAELYSRFDKLLIPILEELENNNERVGVLKKTRDLLLPKLMSGKIRVPVEVSQ